jgi:hypothetical protein
MLEITHSSVDDGGPWDSWERKSVREFDGVSASTRPGTREWSIFVSLGEFDRSDAFAKALGEALATAGGVESVEREDRECWSVHGDCSGPDLVSAVVSVVDGVLDALEQSKDGLSAPAVDEEVSPGVQLLNFLSDAARESGSTTAGVTAQLQQSLRQVDEVSVSEDERTAVLRLRYAPPSVPIGATDWVQLRLLSVMSAVTDGTLEKSHPEIAGLTWQVHYQDLPGEINDHILQQVATLFRLRGGRLSWDRATSAR